MNLPPKFIEFLKNEVRILTRELNEILELPDAKRLRSRIKKEKKDSKEMLYLYKEINATNEAIRSVKDRIRACQDLAKKFTGKGLLRVRRGYIKRDVGYDE